MDLVRTSQLTSSDSSTFQGYRYDVFLSFRGEDTRKNFTDHLYTALNNAGFLTFRDDDELERGEDIKPGLQKAIQQSRTSVVVFSKNYASSRWCLDELVVILERKRTTSEYVVLPVFYDVDPSHLRKQTGSIGKAFARHKKSQSPEKVKGWKEALAEVADLAGMVLQNQDDGREVPGGEGTEGGGDCTEGVGGELSAGGGADLEPYGGGVTVANGGDFSGVSPSSASGESDEGDGTSAGGGGDSGGEASAGGVGEDLGRYESKFIQKIVKVIGDKLTRIPLIVEPKLVGVKSQVEDINMWLQDGSTDVGILLVYGMPGIGKTTIAKHVYNSNFTSFERSSFIENIKERADHQNGLVQIQMQLLSDILNNREVKIHSVNEGIIMIERAISSRRVLLVLDDVDHIDQLDVVLKTKDRFYPGSKILITTKLERLLKMHQVTKVHKLETLDDNGSLELFSWHAFGQDHPRKDYMEYAKKVVHHCGGLPLALKVLGSSLSGESIGVWESALEKLKVIPNGEIMKKLRISYDSLLDDHDQKLFLHIACFLIGRDKKHIVGILDGCDFYTTVGIQNLIDRCLVTIDVCNNVQMHGMIRDMGREIVRQESEEPEKRSRLWRHKDSFKILREKNGTQTIQGLVLDMHMLPANSPINTNETILETNAFERMRKLQLLHLVHVRLKGCYAKFPLGLRWLCWQGFPLDSIPIDFPLESVVVLEMQYSSLRQVCKGTKFLPSLKILDVSHSHGLSEIMDFLLCPNLEELILVDCTSLIDVHESIGTLERLVYLNMKGCKHLRMLPRDMCMLKSLETLILSDCSNLDQFPVEAMKNMESLKVLEIENISLSELWPERCSTIFSSFPCSLVRLNLSWCNLSDDVFPSDLCNLSSLQAINLGGNPICRLPDFIKGLWRLVSLSFENCTRLESLVGLPKVDQLIRIPECTSLQKITFQSFGFPSSVTCMKDNKNLVEWQYDYKLEPIDKVDVEMIKLLGLRNLESLPAIRMNPPRGCTRPKKGTWSPVQGLYQHGIFSTFFVENEVPGRFSYKSTKSSIFFTVPLLDSHRIRGLNIFAIYVNNDYCKYDVMDNSPPIMTKVSNKSKGLKWLYVPRFYGIPGEGEDMIWLSHWKMENETILQCGDKVLVSVMTGPLELFRIKEFGVELVQEHQDKLSTQHNLTTDPHYPFVIGGDLSMWEHIPGIYFLGYDKRYFDSIDLFTRRWFDRVITTDPHDPFVIGGDLSVWLHIPGMYFLGYYKRYLTRIDLLTRRWFERVIMDSDEEDKEGGQDDEPDNTMARTRAANNNCGLRGWKVLLTAAGFFFTLTLVVQPFMNVVPAKA